MLKSTCHIWDGFAVRNTFISPTDIGDLSGCPHLPWDTEVTKKTLHPPQLTCRLGSPSHWSFNGCQSCNLLTFHFLWNHRIYCPFRRLLARDTGPSKYSSKFSERKEINWLCPYSYLASFFFPLLFLWLDSIAHWNPEGLSSHQVTIASSVLHFHASVFKKTNKLILYIFLGSNCFRKVGNAKKNVNKKIQATHNSSIQNWPLFTF